MGREQSDHHRPLRARDPPQHPVATQSDLYDLLRTLEDSWSLTPLTTNDGAATSLIDAFRTAPSSDLTPPTTPSGLTATAPLPTPVDLSWNPSADVVGVTRYEIYRDGAWLGWTAGTTFTDTRRSRRRATRTASERAMRS